MITRSLIAIATAVVLMSTPLEAIAQAYGTEFPFVLGSGARAAGMGGTGASLRGDASVQYYNPSAMSYLQWKEFVFFRTALFDADAVYHAFSYAHPILNYGTFGVSLLRLDVSKIEERDISNQLLSDDLHNSQTRLLLGYAQNVTSVLAAGFNIKIDHQSFGEFSGSGVGLDIGISATQHRSGYSFFRGFRQGLAIQNLIEPAVKLDQDKVSDPMQFALGVSALSAYKSAILETSVDLVNPRFSPFRVHVGQEISYRNLYSFRFGFDEEGAAFGLGARYKNVNVDYAFRSVDVGNNHRFSLAVRFGVSIAEQRTQTRARLENELNTKIGERMNELERFQVDASLHRGDSLFALGQYEKALSQFEAALQWDLDNEHASHYERQCRYHRAMEQSDEAVNRDDCARGIFYAKQALELIPDDPDALSIIDRCNTTLAAAQNRAELMHDLLNTAIDFYANGQYTEALAGFSEVTRLDPSNKLAAEYRKKCHLQIDDMVRGFRRDAETAAKRGDYTTAIDLLRRALVLSPNDSSIEATIAELSQRRHQVPPELSAPVIPTQPIYRPEMTPQDLKRMEQSYNQGMEAFKEGDLDKSVRFFTEVWGADPNFHDVSNLLTKAYVLKGMRLYSRDYLAEAIELWNKALVVDPHNSKVKRYLARVTNEFKNFSTVEDE